MSFNWEVWTSCHHYSENKNMFYMVFPFDQWLHMAACQNAGSKCCMMKPLQFQSWNIGNHHHIIHPTSTCMSLKKLRKTKQYIINILLLMEEILHPLKGNLSHYLQGFSTIPGGHRRISEPSTVWMWLPKSHPWYFLFYSQTRIDHPWN